MAILRNFSAEAIGVMADSIDDNVGTLWDFFEGSWSNICAFFTGAGTVREDVNGLNRYLNHYMEIEDVTHRELLALLDAVKEVEDRYSQKFRDSAEKLREIQASLRGCQTELSETAQNYETVNATLLALYGAGVSYDEIMNDPEKLAQARYDAEQKGLDFPLSAAQLAASEAAYQQLLLVHSPTGIGVGGYNQLDWIYEEDAKGKKFTAAFANVACYATCMLMIAQFYGHDVTMALLVKDGFVSGSGYGNATWPFYTEDRNFGNQGETANCQKIYEELLQNRPVVVALGVGNNTHFVVATGIKSGAIPPYTYDEITVMDPMAEYTLEKQDREPSHYWTLADAIDRKGQGVADIRATTPGPGPAKEDGAQ